MPLPFALGSVCQKRRRLRSDGGSPLGPHIEEAGTEELMGSPAEPGRACLVPLGPPAGSFWTWLCQCLWGSIPRPPAWWMRHGCHVSGMMKEQEVSPHSASVPLSLFRLHLAMMSLRARASARPHQETYLRTSGESVRGSWGSDGFLIFKPSLFFLPQPLPSTFQKYPEGPGLSLLLIRGDILKG